ncbi:MAG TPA: flagellar assembly peptidoglycan hydrolase FlgJ [Burkholderiaceae bacterium]|nr:flagellar assembly peptidoglycan hydrolase FlgJ [Burkholderiaceae bacterium]
MDQASLGSQIGSVGSGLAADARSLEDLKRAARDDPRQAAKKVATQFEALYMQMVLKSMREATPRSGLLDSQEQDMYRGMLDQQVAQQIASKGTGLSDMIARQLSRALPNAAASAAAPSSAKATEGKPGAAAPSAPAPTPSGPGVSTEVQRAFMRQHWAEAVRAQQLTGVPASFILGQAALESGWGQREIRGADGAPSYNLFGIKAGAGWQGHAVQVATTEYDGAMPSRTVQSFRAYDSYAAAFQDWALTIGRNQRYSAAVAASSTAGGFASGMQQAGYSTDPGYAEKLARVIRTASSVGGTV